MAGREHLWNRQNGSNYAFNSIATFRWQGWAASLIPQFIDRTLLGSFYGDLRGFIATLSHQYFEKEAPPPGPTLMPQSHISEERMSGPIPQFDSTSFMFPTSIPASSSGPSGPHFDVSGGEVNHHLSSQTVSALNVELTTPVSNSYQTVSDEGISYNLYSHKAPLFDIPSRAFNTLLQGYRQPPTNRHQAGASRFSRDENDDHSSDEPVVHAGIQSEHVQVRSMKQWLVEQCRSEEKYLMERWQIEMKGQLVPMLKEMDGQMN